MHPRKVSLGEMWKSDEGGEVYIVTSFYNDLFGSYAWLRSVDPRHPDRTRKAKMLKTASRETLMGLRMAEIV